MDKLVLWLSSNGVRINFSYLALCRVLQLKYRFNTTTAMLPILHMDISIVLFIHFRLGYRLTLQQLYNPSLILLP